MNLLHNCYVPFAGFFDRMGGERVFPALLSPRSPQNVPMPRDLPLLTLCAAAQAADVAQFRAEDFGTPWR